MGAAADLAHDLIEAKCPFCRGFKFLRGGYPCPQCGGTGGEPEYAPGASLPEGGLRFNNLKEAFNHWWRGTTNHGFMQDAYAALGNGPVMTYYNYAPNTTSEASVKKVYEILQKSGNQRVSSNPQVLLFTRGVANADAARGYSWAFILL